MAHRPDELRADFQQFYSLNLDDLGSAYSYSHAATLAAMLPPTARVYCGDALGGVPLDIALLSIIEWDAHMSWWVHTDEAQKKHAKLPEPLIDLGGKQKGEGHAMDLDELKDLLKRKRREVPTDGR